MVCKRESEVLRGEGERTIRREMFLFRSLTAAGFTHTYTHTHVCMAWFVYLYLYQVRKQFMLESVSKKYMSSKTKYYPSNNPKQHFSSYKGLQYKHLEKMLHWTTVGLHDILYFTVVKSKDMMMLTYFGCDRKCVPTEFTFSNFLQLLVRCNTGSYTQNSRKVLWRLEYFCILCVYAVFLLGW